MATYCIQAAMFKLPIPFVTCFTHDFWILRNLDTNRVIAQLHGLAISRETGQIVPIGYFWDHSLRAHSSVYDQGFAKQHNLQVNRFALPVHDSVTIHQDKDCEERWLKAIKAIKHINELDLDYPPGGFRFPFNVTINSNSIYHTFAAVMDLPIHKFKGFFHIGIETSVYPQIKQFL
ncbi:MAG TPA: hypothetical protein PK657_00465 [Legionella sp.]|nr:hypothetical protein [Legionella sp.]